ncbi:CGNR zinc finger domain-containing protein [Leifsonia poae]|uniref:CGNR zinc finger domain-containing protein n=1 Tax=Leifsonia poae TaxID=110933 RepID=UPI001CBB61A3|nr:CGNR zinc finger domain-containing protein [Leifsonia poae]
MPTIAPALGAELLVDFLNTLDIEEGADTLDDGAAFEVWANRHGVGMGDRAEARAVRDSLRALVDGGSASLPAVELETACSERSVELTASTAAQAAVAASVILSIQGRLDRVKLCHADDCRWAFYDRSRNGSRNWCSMGVCGNRQKARAYRARQGDAADGPTG